MIDKGFYESEGRELFSFKRALSKKHFDVSSISRRSLGSRARQLSKPGEAGKRGTRVRLQHERED